METPKFKKSLEGNGEAEAEPSAAKAFEEIQSGKQEEGEPISGGVPVGEAIAKMAKIMRAVFGRNIPDEVYRTISLDPQMFVTILQTIGCDDEPIEFLGNLSPKTRHWIALGSFGAFCVGNAAMVFMNRRKPEIQAVIRYHQMGPEQQKAYEQQLREFVAKQAELEKRQTEAKREAEPEPVA